MAKSDDNVQVHLSALQEFYAANRVLPTYSRMMPLLGYRSKSAVHAAVKRLVKEGYLEEPCANRLAPTPRFFERGLALSSVRAGFPSPATEGLSDSLSIDEYLIQHPSATVLVTVKGDSMIDAQIAPGDIAIVERAQTANPGDIVVANVDNEFTIKTLRKDRKGYYLEPANENYPVLRPTGKLEIFGKVVGLFRKYPD